MKKTPRMKGLMERILTWQWVRQRVYFTRLEEIDSYFYSNARGGKGG